MLREIVAQLKGILCALLAVFFTLSVLIPILLLALIKWFASSVSTKARCTDLVIAIFERWATLCRATYFFIHSVSWDVQGYEGLSRDKSYLVICNHQSWSDIPIMAFPLLGQVPFFKFFAKRELIWVPLIGVACWALDFPMMRRYSRAELENNPELRSRDLATTRQLCEKLSGKPVTIVNYIEGTRFRPEKKIKQQSPYRHLLKPKSGGLAYVVSMLGENLDALVDITIVYPQGRQGFWQLLTGRLGKVVVRAKLCPIPTHLLQGDYQASAEYRKNFQQWIAQLWEEKDTLIDSCLERSIDQP